MSEKSEKSVIIPAIFDDCEAIQIVNGVPALVINDKDGTNEFFNVPADEFIRRTGISERVLKDLSVLLGMPLYWMQVGYIDEAYRFLENPTLFNCYQAYNNTLIARGANFSTSGSTFGARPFTILLQYDAPYEEGEDGTVTLIGVDD